MPRPNSKGKHGPARRQAGRPTKYRSDYPQRVEAAAETHAPLTDEQIAALLAVDERTVKDWYARYPDFLASVRKAKAVSDDRVERSLYERATGYSYPDVHISTHEGEVIVTPIIRHCPPDVAAAFIWLKNRRPYAWRDHAEVEHAGVVTVVHDARPAMRLCLSADRQAVSEALPDGRQALSASRLALPGPVAGDPPDAVPDALSADRRGRQEEREPR